MNRKSTAVLRFSSLVTPSPNDPADADAFYRSLGIMMIAWGRLEGHFTLSLLNLMRIVGPKHVSHRLPLPFQVRAETWRTAMVHLALPTALIEDAIDLADAIEALSQERNKIVHAMWEGFAAEGETGIATISIKHQKGTADELVLDRKTITQHSLDAVTERCNARNVDLNGISLLLGKMFPTPAGAREV